MWAWKLGCIYNSIPIKCGTHIWAASWENLFMSNANNNYADQSAHPRSQISAFVVRCLDGIIPLVSISEISILYLAAEAEQTGLSLTCSKTPKTGFSWRGSYILVICLTLIDRNRTACALRGIIHWTPSPGCIASPGTDQSANVSDMQILRL